MRIRDRIFRGRSLAGWVLPTLLTCTWSHAAPGDGAAPLVAAAAASNTFALAMYRQLATPMAGNVFFSPSSISTALGMVLAGARGETAAQMAAPFHASLGAPELASALGVLHQALAKPHAGLDLEVANSLWPQDNHPFLPEYLSTIKDNFDSAVYPLNFVADPAAARGRINAWITQQTKGKITDALPAGSVGPLTRLVLVNTIYFKGTWFQPFSPNLTAPAPFHVLAGAPVAAPLMHLKAEVTSYGDVADGPVPMQILSLPYRGFSASLVVLLPRANDGLAALEKNLTAKNLAGWLSQLSQGPRTVDVYLPKFKLSERYQLNDALTALGMTDAFDPAAANFTDMDGARDLFVSLVAHQAVLDVNETGTEAAAATEGVMAGAAEELAPTPVFRADHPFLFFIRDEATGTVLFLGRYVAPSG